MSFCELSSIQPYLVNNFIAAFNSLGIDVFCFVVISFISVRIYVCIRNLISQFFVIIKKFRTSDIEFLCIQDILLWLELRSFRRSYLVVEFFIFWFSHNGYKSFRSCVMFHFNSYNSFHCIVSDSTISTFHFFNCILVNAFFTLLELKS